MSLLSRLAVQAARAYGMLVAGSANNVSADYLVVAGGGGSGGGGNSVGAFGGGGGAGGYRTSTFTLSTLNTYSIIVGAGGNGGALTVEGTKGNNSAVSGTGLTTVTSTGGGYGGGAATSAAGDAGGPGGSGGGGGGNSSGGAGGAGGTGNQGAYSPVEGYNGAGSVTGGFGGGGGGSSAAATNQNGAAGTANSISGSSVTYAAGGSGTSGAAIAGTANTGNGAKGGGENFTGAAGGSGIVIISYTSATPKFVGGTITTSGGKQIHTFTSSGTLSPITPITASYLVVAGGGGGGPARAGGGGAGGLLTSSTTLYSGATYVVTVGGGGAVAAIGSNSVLSGTGITTVTSIGGGRGANPSTSTPASSGGSGGGGCANDTSNPSLGTGGAGTSGQGFAGGNATLIIPNYGGGGGGGAGAAGSVGGNNFGGNGGIGVQSSISGTATYYAGGGGGGKDSSGGTAGTGGLGGGGNGQVAQGAAATAGTTNTGGGGGGGGGTVFVTDGTGGAGGSGIVIISYAGSQQFNGGLVTTSGGNTIHTFTSTGALTPLTNNLNNSLRFRASASAYLNRTPSVAGNSKTWTWSGWVKRGTLNSSGSLGLFEAFTSPYNSSFRFASDTLNFQQNDVSGRNITWGTSAVFRDPSAWYHIVLVCDTTQAAVGNAIKMYVNGNQQTVTATINSGSYAQNLDTYVNAVSISQRLGTYYNGNYFDGYLTDVYLIDGQALEPYYFGNNDANGVWKPIQYKGTYGTNGFYLTFGNTTSTTTLGYDSSPNGNNWTCNNISLTAGSTYDAMTDVPTNTSATVANYCTLNPIATNTVGVGTLSNANLNFSIPNTFTVYGTMSASSGKYYWEAVATSSPIGVGIKQLNVLDRYSNTIYYMGSSLSAGEKYVNGTGSAYGASWTTGDVIGVAVDMDGGTVTFYKNNASQGSINLSLATITEFVPTFVSGAGATFVGYVNFGQRPFTYTPPTGYVALNTYNLPTPTILQGNKYMDATLYTGTGTTNVVVNQAQFKPDLVWVKNRNTTDFNILQDSVRGTGKELFSNATGAEETYANSLTSFNSNGFTLGSRLPPNNTGSSYVGWQWQSGQGSTSSNTSGSITSTVSVNTTAGFSIVTWTGNGTIGATVGHGLGVTPSMIIVKQRNGTEAWPVYHISTGATKYTDLSNTAATATSITRWNNTAPSSTVITLYNDAATNGSSSTYVAYCFAAISGFSAFGSYTGNGSADGPFVFTNFRPKFVMTKRTDSSTNGFWNIYDSSRNGYNDDNDVLYPNSSSAEDNVQQIDLLSNGFKLRNATYPNTSGGTYIYAAFAEAPFKISNSR